MVHLPGGKGEKSVHAPFGLGRELPSIKMVASIMIAVIEAWLSVVFVRPETLTGLPASFAPR